MEKCKKKYLALCYSAIVNVLWHYSTIVNQNIIILFLFKFCFFCPFLSMGLSLSRLNITYLLSPPLSLSLSLSLSMWSHRHFLVSLTLSDTIFWVFFMARSTWYGGLRRRFHGFSMWLWVCRILWARSAWSRIW